MCSAIKAGEYVHNIGLTLLIFMVYKVDQFLRLIHVIIVGRSRIVRGSSPRWRYARATEITDMTIMH